MFNELQNDFDNSVRKMAESNVLKKLDEQGTLRHQVDDEKFNELVALEMEILKSDGKKVGVGMAIGIGLSILTGGIF